MAASRDSVPRVRRRSAQSVPVPSRALRRAASARQELPRAALAGLAEGVLVVAPDRRVLLANRAAEQLLGLSRPDRVLPFAVVEGVTRRNHLGRRIRLAARPLAGSPSARLVTVQEMATPEARRTLVGGAQDQGTLTLDPLGRITGWSAGAERLAGHLERDVLGRSFQLMFTADQLAAGLPAQLLAAARERGLARDEGLRVRSDGSTYWASAVVTAVYAEDGSLHGYVGVVHDASHTVALREVDTVKNDLIATVSHELRTPLTSIRGYTELLLDGEAGTLGTLQRRMLGVIDTNGARLLALVEDMLSVASVDNGGFTVASDPVDVPALLARVDARVRPGLPSGTSLTRRLPQRVPLVSGDDGQLERALLSLVGNAIKFSPDGGQITLSCDYDDREIRLAVTDTGLGIPADEQAGLFQRFFRASGARERHVRGAGLGLALVKSIAEGHGGRVALVSAPGEGTAVTLHLPRQRG